MKSHVQSYISLGIEVIEIQNCGRNKNVISGNKPCFGEFNSTCSNMDVSMDPIDTNTTFNVVVLVGSDECSVEVSLL